MNKKERILIIHNAYQVSGGEDMVAANEKTMLEHYGHQVFFYGRSNSELKSMNLIQKFFLPAAMIFNLRSYNDIRRIVKEKKIDIVHVHNTLTLISPSVYYAALRCKVPVVQTVHNFRFLCPGATFYRGNQICEDCVKKGLICAVKFKCYRNSRIQTLACVFNMNIHRRLGIYKKINYICLTEFNREKLLEFKQIKKEQIFIKPNFVEDCAAMIPGTERKNQFIFAGRLEKLKGIDFLLNTWKQMGEHAPMLIVCGTGPMEEWCRQFVSKNRMETVRMEGFVPNWEIRKQIGESKALILPTRWYEGFPVSIMEAFSVGTPVLCSDLGNTGSLISDGINGIRFMVDSEKELIEAVLYIVKNKTIYETTYHTYLKKYTMQKNYTKLMQIYRNITEEFKRE